MACTVAWESQARSVTGWQLDQCRNLPSGCRWEALQSFDAETMLAVLEDLQKNQSQCWRIEVLGGPQGGQVSNMVCR